MKYNALVVDETDGNYIQTVKILDTGNLPAGELLVKVLYSSLNYKDALSATGNKGVTKRYPHTPGIDAAGIVEVSASPQFAAGEKVIVTGYDLGMNTPGGFGEYIRVPAEWAVKLPENLTPKEAMIIGTAGFTAGISLTRLAELVKPADGKIAVTGASGGVGSMAVSLLAQAGYSVIAVSGKENEYSFIKMLGASETISRTEFMETENRPMLSATFAGAIDTAGGMLLERILKSLNPLGAVTTCGSVASTALNTTVFPFILRGITLIGISAQNYPSHLRKPLWEKLATVWKPVNLMKIYSEITLADIPDAVNRILQGKLKGRTIIKI